MNLTDLTTEVCTALIRRGITLATAESCTGGLIAAHVTDVPGVSAVFRGGIVCYTNAVKNSAVGVPEELLERCGAVSDEVCRALCEGVRLRLSADLGLSVTGVAGPDPDDRGNPVGLIYVGLSDGTRTEVRTLHLTGTRAENRRSACRAALELAKNYLKR